MTKFPIKLSITDKGRIQIPVFIKRKEGIKMGKTFFKYDLGVDFSTISKSTLRGLGYDDNWISKNAKIDELSTVTAANGKKVFTYYVQLPLINVMGFEDEEWPFYIQLPSSLVSPFTDDCSSCKDWSNLNEVCNKCSNNQPKENDFRNLFGLDLQAGFEFVTRKMENHVKVFKFPKFMPIRRFVENQEIHSLEVSGSTSISDNVQRLLEFLKVTGPIRGLAKDNRAVYNFDIDIDILSAVTELKLANLVEVKENEQGFSAQII